MKALPLHPAGRGRSTARRGSALLRRLVEGPYPLLVAVALVVVLVSLPLLRGLALRANERDALRTMRLFGRQVFAAPAGEPVSLGTLVESDSRLRRRLPDTRLLDDGRRIFRHGYLFDLVPGPDGSQLLRGWPYAHGESGLAAFLMGPDGRLLATPNHPGSWSGQTHPPRLVGPGPHQPRSAWRHLSAE